MLSSGENVSSLAIDFATDLATRLRISPQRWTCLVSSLYLAFLICVVAFVDLPSRETPPSKLSGLHAVAIRLLGLPPIVFGHSFVATQW